MGSKPKTDLIVLDPNTRQAELEVHELGLAGIDDNHQEFVELLQGMEQAEEDGLFRDIYHELHLHTERHFQREFDYMIACEFFAMVEHHADHTRILNELVQHRMHMQQGRLSDVREFVTQRLTPWFQQHLRGYDAVMARAPHFRPQQRSKAS